MKPFTSITHAALVMGLTIGSAHAIEIYPTDPVQGEQVVFSEVFCQAGSPTWVETATATLGSGNIDVVIDFFAGDFSVPSCARGTVASPPLPAGSLAVRYRTGVVLPPDSTVVTTLQVPAAASVTPQYTGLSGNWFNAASSGTGLNIIQGESGALLAAWLTYVPTSNDNAPAQPLWLIMPSGKWITPTRFRGVVYMTTGSSMNQPWLPASLGTTVAGVMTLGFDSANQVRFEAVALHPNFSTFNVSTTLTRFAF